MGSGLYRKRQELERAIGQLPEDNRKAIELYFFHQLSRKDIASLLGWSVSKVNTKLTRGISLLKWRLNPAYFEKARRIWESLQESGSH